ncbi:unnamed protein product [Cochlearia groenlandica]
MSSSMVTTQEEAHSELSLDLLKSTDTTVAIIVLGHEEKQEEEEEVSSVFKGLPKDDVVSKVDSRFSSTDPREDNN